MKHSLDYFLREAERCVPYLAPEERRKWAEECHASHPGVTEEHKTAGGPLPGGRGSVRPVGAWKWAGVALVLACAAREARCQDPAGFNGGLDPAFRNVPLVWVMNAPNGSCSGVEIRYAFSANPPALYGCNAGTWANLTAGGGGSGGSGTVTSVGTNNGLIGGTITVSGTLGLAPIAAGGMLCNTGTTSQAPAIANCGISVPQSVTGTTAVSASSPLALNATTGNLTCSTCVSENSVQYLSNSSATSPVTLASSPAAGQYEIHYALDLHTPCTTGTGQLYLTYGYTANAARTITTGNWPLTATQAASVPLSGVLPIVVNSGGVTFTPTLLTACSSGTATWDGAIWLEGPF